MENYKKLFDMDLMTLFKMMIFLYSDKSNKDLLYFALKALTKKYKNLLISDSVINSKEIDNPNYINCLNQLFKSIIRINFWQKNFENIRLSKFNIFVREPNNRELQKYYNDFYSKIIEDYFKSNLLENGISKVNRTSFEQIPKSTTFKKINIDEFSPKKNTYILNLMNLNRRIYF